LDDIKTDRQLYTYFKNIYCVLDKLIASETVRVFEVVRTQCFFLQHTASSQVSIQ